MEHWVFSDGCAAQFEGGRCWYHVARYPKYTISPHQPEACRMVRSLLGSGHGKANMTEQGPLQNKHYEKSNANLMVYHFGMPKNLPHI